jgi:general secretion pathway protein A
MSTSTYQCFFSYFGLRDNPFHVSPDPVFYYPLLAHDSAKKELLFGLQTCQGLSVLTGEAGTGKTTILNAILESLDQRHISSCYVFHPLLEPIELFKFILRDFGINFDGSAGKGEMIRNLHEWLFARNGAGDSPVLIIDEAQSLSIPILDELRLLLNLENPGGKLLQIILAGQSELEEKLRDPQLRQLRQRVMFHCKLPLLSEQETLSYVRSRLSSAGLCADSRNPFSEETLLAIHKYSRGIPRVINTLCEHALITGYGEQQQTIAPEIIQRTAVDFDLAAKPISVQDEQSTGTFGRLIDFPSDSEPVQPLIDAALAAAAERLPSVVPLSPVPAIHPTQLQHVAVPERRVLHRASTGFSGYWKQVGQSFLKDCRRFRESFAASGSGARPVLPETSED